ncbi:hypothetical protein H2203_007658 [Taxawa tesnikishii (nom. ined.)]|nr:hypothetical protein H2203_007658 [Dothideales sp. JES 119]
MNRELATPQDSEEESTHATWLPRDIRYDEAFENSVKEIVENPPSGPTGIRLLLDDSAEDPEPGVSVRIRDVKARDLPTIRFGDLPLPLDDSRRKFASPIPGINLTHPGGYLEGARDKGRGSPARNTGGEIASCRELVEERMKDREDALQHNARIEKEIKTLMDQREMEVKIETRMKEEAREKRERRERKRAMRKAG